MQSLRFHLYRLRSPSFLLSSLLHEAVARGLRPLAPASSSPHISAPPGFSVVGLASRHLSSRSGGGKDGAWDKPWNAEAGRSPAAPGEAGGGGEVVVPDLGWDEASSWSTGLTEEHFDGKAVGRRRDPWEEVASAPKEEAEEDILESMERDNRRSKEFVDGWGNRMKETVELLKQVREPGARGSYLKDSEKAEMYRLHKENPEVYTVERLAKDYRIMRQRVHAILWLKEIEEEEEKKLGRPLDDSVEQLLDACPE